MSILWIKIIASLSMLLDHVGSFQPFAGWEYLRTVGRVAYPLYAFMLVQGFIHTRSRLKYLARILVLALITQPIYTYCFDGIWWKWDSPNILFTLSAGLCGMWLLELGKQRAQKRKKAWWISCIAISAATGYIVYLANAFGFDYGWEGVLLMLLLYLTAEYRWACIPIVTLFALRKPLQTGAWDEPVYQRAMFSVVAIIPMLLYNGNPGPKPQSKWGAALIKYGFYLFYPLHLAVLALVFR